MIHGFIDLNNPDKFMIFEIVIISFVSTLIVISVGIDCYSRHRHRDYEEMMDL